MKAKHEINAISIQALKDLLIEIIDNPSEFSENTVLKQALKSQGALAKHGDKARGIIPCSLNTQKSTAERVLENGYESIDFLRKSALQAIEDIIDRSNKSNKSTKAGQRKKINELEQDIALLEQQNIMLIALVQSLKGKLEHYAQNSDKQLAENINQDLIDINAKISFTYNANLMAQAFKDD